MMSKRGDEILDQHFPALGRGNAIVQEHFQDLASGSARIGASTRINSMSQLNAKILRMPPVSVLAVAIANHAKSGGRVDINQWAGGMEAAGISADTIARAYEAAGGSNVLAPAEAAGDTSHFLHAFVTDLEKLGAPSAAIEAAYRHAAGVA